MPFSTIEPAHSFDSLSTNYLAEETGLVRHLIQTAHLTTEARTQISTAAIALAEPLKQQARHPDTVDAFLQEYSLSSNEGVLLMRLAESLIRTPDTQTATLLLRDKLMAGHWRDHLGAKTSLVKVGTAGLVMAKSWIKATGGVTADHLLARLGDRVLLSAVRSAVGLLGRQFVLGKSIANAQTRGRRSAIKGSTFSYDMLGEAALTRSDADRYFRAYESALTHLARNVPTGTALHDAPALSVKLSALHPRYEYATRDTCVPEITERLLQLCQIAKQANLGLTIDAEEVDRLEVSLLVFERLLASPEIKNWDGLGLAIQAYQRRALPTIEWIQSAAEKHQQKITVRLVKGAYWDSEIKRAQELGLSDYPVFTQKSHSDISYLACARMLLERPELIYPQFATHNAHSAAAIIHMAGDRRDLEFQRLYGMSDGLHRLIHDQFGFRVRTYAPVGKHKELLPYLVRRLLENGANNSFVNQLLDETIETDELIHDPIAETETNGLAPHPLIHAPRDHFSGRRLAASGLDLTQSQAAREVEAIELPSPPAPAQTKVLDLQTKVATCAESTWASISAHQRANALRRAADLLEQDAQRFMALCVTEAGKTWLDADAEVREAVDFLRYYANQAERHEISSLEPMGPVACISPWNFPLAIFIGQVSAALVVGNSVIAKPAEQTPGIAQAAVDLLYTAGIPTHALQLAIGDGEIGGALTADAAIKGVCFTGSTATAKKIAATLAETGRAQIPLVAETGGINAMVIDSTALLEQAVQDVVDSAFQSAGQRCSACRVVCVQSDVADAFNAMLAGAIADLKTGDPANLETDVGPVIDAAAQAGILSHVERLRERFTVIAEGLLNAAPDGTFIAPIAFELDQINDLTEEVFGPVLHVVRFEADAFDAVLDQINALGFGLTMGLHTRMDARVDQVAAHAKIGNLYVNRNQIGAVVGVQPFGGLGLSGTGPKAGGPNYLARLCTPARALNQKSVPETTSLPGPTGESNTLSYHPRGRLLCLGGDHPEIIAQQMKRATETGNTAIKAQDMTVEEIVQIDDIQGVIADGARRETIAATLAHRPGAILPLLSASDPVERFFIEKVVTIDTTAAGGNASLLAQI